MSKFIREDQLHNYINSDEVPIRLPKKRKVKKFKDYTLKEQNIKNIKKG